MYCDIVWSKKCNFQTDKISTTFYMYIKFQKSLLDGKSVLMCLLQLASIFVCILRQRKITNWIDLPEQKKVVFHFCAFSSRFIQCVILLCLEMDTKNEASSRRRIRTLSPSNREFCNFFVCVQAHLIFLKAALVIYQLRN